MASPIGYVELSGVHFDGDGVSCTGGQLVEIIDSLEEFAELVWYAADVDAIPISGVNNGLRGHHAQRVGSRTELTKFVEGVDQFLSGVFLGVPSNCGNIYFSAQFETEDSRSRDMGFALVEIRAFDTTYYEIYFSDISLAEIFSDKFDAQLTVCEQ